MADYRNVQIHGLEELKKTLAALPDNMERNVLRGAVRAGTIPIRDEAKRLAPKDTGEMKLAINIRQAPAGKRRNPTEYWVYVRSKRRKEKARKKKDGQAGSLPNAWYWHFVEFGHHIVPRGKRINRKRTNIDKVSIGFVPAKPFMRPAFEFKKRQAIVEMRRYIKERLAREDFRRR